MCTCEVGPSSRKFFRVLLDRISSHLESNENLDFFEYFPVSEEPWKKRWNRNLFSQGSSETGKYSKWGRVNHVSQHQWQDALANYVKWWVMSPSDRYEQIDFNILQAFRNSSLSFYLSTPSNFLSKPELKFYLYLWFLLNIVEKSIVLLVVLFFVACMQLHNRVSLFVHLSIAFVLR